MLKEDRTTLREVLLDRGIDIDDLKDDLVEFLDAISEIKVGQIRGGRSNDDHEDDTDENLGNSLLPDFGFFGRPGFASGPLTSRALMLTSGLRATHSALEGLLPAIAAIDKLAKSPFFERLRRPRMKRVE